MLLSSAFATTKVFWIMIRSGMMMRTNRISSVKKTITLNGLPTMLSSWFLILVHENLRFFLSSLTDETAISSPSVFFLEDLVDLIYIRDLIVRLDIEMSLVLQRGQERVYLEDLAVTNLPGTHDIT